VWRKFGSDTDMDSSIKFSVYIFLDTRAKYAKLDLSKGGLTPHNPILMQGV